MGRRLWIVLFTFWPGFVLAQSGPAVFSIKNPRSAFPSGIEVLDLKRAASGEEAKEVSGRSFEIDAKASEVTIDDATKLKYISALQLRSPGAATDTAQSAVLRFTRPFSGNRLWLLDRLVSYRTGTPSPSTKDLIVSIVDKYGLPSASGRGTLLYIFRDQKKIIGATTTKDALLQGWPGTFDRDVLATFEKCPDLVQDFAQIVKVDHTVLAGAIKNIRCDGFLAFRIEEKSGQVAEFATRYLDAGLVRDAAEIDAATETELRSRPARPAPTIAPPKL